MLLDKHVTDTLSCSKKHELNNETRNRQDGAGRVSVYMARFNQVLYVQAFSHRGHLNIELYAFSIRFMPILMSKGHKARIAMYTLIQF
jgi:hypothetical protein